MKKGSNAKELSYGLLEDENVPARKVRWRELYAMALDSLREERYDEAIRVLTKAISSGAKRWEPYYARAWTRWQAGQSLGDGQVRKDLERALEFGGTRCADAAVLLGALELEQGNAQVAFRLFLQGFGNASDAASAEEGLVEALSSLLDELEASSNPAASLSVTESLESYLQSVTLPTHLSYGLLAEVLACRAHLLEQTNEEDQAEKCIRRLRLLVPGHPRLPADTSATTKRSSALREGGSEPTFDDIGGNDVGGSFQERLCKLFETYFGKGDLERARLRLAEYGQSPTRSVLLFGPSGCGKTYIVRSFAGEYRKRFARELPLHTLRLNELFDRYVGESEKILTRAIDRVISSQPSLLFADEIDALGGSRDSGQDWRVSQTAHFLQEIDRLRERETYVVFFACTNRIWAIDQALLRRFDRLIAVEPPNAEVRKRIFEVHLNHCSERVRPEALDFEKLTARSHGLTPGDIEKVVRHAVDEAMQESFQAEEPRRIKQDDLLRSLEDYQHPMHLRTWVQDAITGLRNARHADMADEVERLYRPFVGDLTEDEAMEESWRPMPDEAWVTEQTYDLSYIRAFRS